MMDKYDTIVVGAGMAGIMAAMSAKDGQNRVLLVEPSNVLGGQGTTGGVAGFCGDTKRVNAFFADLVDRLSEYGFIKDYDLTADRREYDLEWCAYFLQEMALEKEIDVLLHSRVVGASVADRRVESLRILTAGGMIDCSCKFVIDASGQCIVADLAGFPLLHEGANRQLPMSLYFTLWDTGKKIRPFLPPNLERWESEDEIPMTSLHKFPSGKVEVKMKVVGFDAADGFSRSMAEIQARRNMISLIYFLQTKGYAGTKLDQHVLATVSRSIGIREEKRIVGEHCLQQEEVMNGAVFHDAVAVGTYHLDYHWPDKAQRAGTGITTMVEPYHIPLSAMTPKGARNLLVPGRSASGDQMAMSSFRVMATVAQMGFAAGHAARLAARSQKGLDDIDIDQLQKNIESGGQSLDLSDYGEYLRQSLLTRERIFDASPPTKSCHASSLVALRNGRFLVAWFGGTSEGNRDTAIWTAYRFEGKWSRPTRVAKVSNEPHWNAVLFKAPDGRVHLYFKVGASPRHWHTWRTISSDEGTTWSTPTPLPNQKGKHALGPVKNKPIALHDGVCLAPNSHEGKSRWAVSVDRSVDGGMTWDPGETIPLETEAAASATGKSPPEEIDAKSLGAQGAIQPTLWESEPGKAHLLARTTMGRLYRSDSMDGGRNWSPLYPTDLPSNNSGIDLARLPGGELVLAYNPVPENWGQRTPLSLAISLDNGASWEFRLDLETSDGEFSYPAVIPTSRGFAVTYTWKRQNIAFWHGSPEHVINPDLIEELDKALHTGVPAVKT